MGSGSGLPLAPPTFGRENTKLPDAISLLRFFKSSSNIGFGKLYVRMVTTPLVHYLILRPFGWLNVKITIKLNTAMM